MSDEFLPLGSVVRLDAEDDLEVMVIGYYPTLDGETRDYLGVPVPTGLLQGGGALSFDADVVLDVVFEAAAAHDERALLNEYVSLHEEQQRLAGEIREELGSTKIAGDE